MTQRERFIASITFEEVDKIPLNPGYGRESTRNRWHTEGLPQGANPFDEACRILGIEYPAPETIIIDPGVNFKLIPEYEEKVLEHKDGHYIVQDWMGAITEISDEYDYTYLRSAKDFVTRKWYKFPVEDRNDWESMKKRYRIDSQGRFPDDFKERCVKIKDRDYVSTLTVGGPFWQMREWLGFEGLCIMTMDDPELVEDMADFWGRFVEGMLDIILENYCPDNFKINEDMAYKAHSMISPAMTRKFIQPAYDRWIPKLKAKGCKVIEVDSDGYIEELIPIWIESGINCCSPMEVAAHNDIVRYRKKFGRNMAFKGGIDKRAIAAGGDIIRTEIERVSPVIKDGGYIPGCDHGVPHDVSWQDYIEYTRLLAIRTGWLMDKDVL